MIAELLCYAGIGSLAGFFAGLLGIGGGVIIGPLLILVYSHLLGFDSAYVAHLAVATACGVIALTAPMSAVTHARQHNIDWRLAGWLGLGVIAGALIGANGAVLVPAALIKILLTGFLTVSSISLLLPARPRQIGHKNNQPRRLSAHALLPVATGVGAISAVLGIGGGAFIVPYLIRSGIVMRRAVGTSAFIGFPLSISAVIGYVWSGHQVQQLPENSWGYIYLPALLGISIFSIAAAYCGALLTNKLPPVWLRRIFSLLTLTIALRLLWSVISDGR